MSKKRNTSSVKTDDKKIRYVFTLLKYAFVLVFPVLSVAINHLTTSYILMAIAEISLIAIVTNVLLRVKYGLAYAVNSISLFFINIQYAFLFFGNSFISLNMLENTDSIKDLGGKFVIYGIAFIILTFFTFLPIKRFDLHYIAEISLGVCVVSVYLFIIFSGRYHYSPVYFTYDLIGQQLTRAEIKKLVNDADIGNNEFFKGEVEDFIPKPKEISEKPNVILIFTEGFSENIIEDTRNVVPNIKALEEKSISFKNYFNHTFATYMALSGQLYSGYQQDNYDKNYLISLQGVFKDYGYDTSMINTEPKNKEFSDYLEGFDFDNVITDTSLIDGMADSISDKSAYDFLLSTAEEKSKGDKPFFISIYTFGTHASLDGVFNKFQNGSNPFLNKFYDLDIQAGRFIKAFEQSDLFDNTVLIFTADHCSYKDADFSSAYPDYPRFTTIVDRIPFMIYYKGVKPACYDVNGRNSLDMTPTVLDFLDMTSKNSFLGESLFSFDKNSSKFNKFSQSYANYYNTSDSTVRDLTPDERAWFEPELVKYFALKLEE